MKLCHSVFAALTSVTVAVPASLESRQNGQLSDYLMVYFTGEGTANGEQIYMAVSNNNNPGSWTTVNNGQPVLGSTVGMKGRRFVHHALFYHFVSFTPAEKWLTGAGMDATVFRDPSSSIFYRVSKNGPNNLIEQARASTLNGPWTVIRNEICQGLPAGEGPLVFRDNITPSKWHMRIDDYTRGRGYQPFETSNIATANWSPAQV
ncbi:hypothetical protein BN1708_009210 [Verticillium longisporum]|uniref:Uncharacterized protein n=1 Tax=Verticillium longisporum TaxID=100787 RepID=A0A0G4KG40_VERLO|nr:hypothetical protein BN1708_009210 [Verticillium longisporum]